jgi:hypothetical protein
MNTILLTLALAGPDPTTPVTWVRTMDEAKAKAAASGRPILWFQLLGDLDQEFC